MLANSSPQENHTMLYLGIDQHSKQITVCLRNDEGEVSCRRQVSTHPAKIRAFFEQMLKIEPQFMAILEVCGFNDWLIAELQQRQCQEIVLIHPEKRSKKKTDRRDANKLSELLWLNRDRLVHGRRVQGLRRVQIPTQRHQDDRQLTALRKRVAQKRTQTLNKIHRILHRHNLMWDYPTKTFQTKKGRRWLETISLPEIDRLELNMLLQQWQLWETQISKLDQRIMDRVQQTEADQIMNHPQLLMTAPGVSFFSALAIICRIGDIQRFPSSRSLANYFGLTPGCRNSGNNNHRLGSITKEGSAMVRFILGQLVIHALKRDPTMRAWYQGIKRRRGSKIARVAVMRKLVTIFWYMLKHNTPYDHHREHHRSGSTKGTMRAQAA
jgi:transposase